MGRGAFGISFSRSRAAEAAARLAQPATFKRVYVGSLHFNINEHMLRAVFEPFGHVRKKEMYILQGSAHVGWHGSVPTLTRLSPTHTLLKRYAVCLLPIPFAFSLCPLPSPYAFCLLPMPFAFSPCLLPSPIPFAFSYAFCLFPMPLPSSRSNVQDNF